MLRHALAMALLLGIPALLAHATDGDLPARTATPTSILDQCEIYPLAKGVTWIFRSGPLEVREKVTQHEEIQGELCARIETFYDDRVVGYEHIAVRADGVYRVAVGGKPVEPPLKFISLPAKPDVKWTVQSTIDGKPIRGEFAASEGTFQSRSPRGDQDLSHKTHRITGDNFHAGDEPISFTYDFVPQIGKVKQTARAHGLETTIELREFVAVGESPTRTASGSSRLFRQ